MSHALASTDAPADAELISAVRGGDVEAYGELFARHVDAARRLARQIAPASDVDDLVSDAFAKVLSVLQRGGGPDVAFRAYLLTSIRRLHVDGIRAGKKVQSTDDLEKFDPGVPFEDTAVAGFENEAAAQAFASLPERWQLVLWHTEVEGQKPAEVALLLGMSANSVSALAYRAREGLRQAFLNQHAQELDADACRWVHHQLGAYVRGGTSRRDSAKVEQHLDECRKCMAIYLELTEVNSNLAGIIAPLLLGVSAAGYLAATSAVTKGGLVLLASRFRDTVSSNGTAVAAACGVVAAGIAIVVGSTMLDRTPADEAADVQAAARSEAATSPSSGDGSGNAGNAGNGGAGGNAGGGGAGAGGGAAGGGTAGAAPAPNAGVAATPTGGTDGGGDAVSNPIPVAGVEAGGPPDGGGTNGGTDGGTDGGTNGGSTGPGNGGTNGGTDGDPPDPAVPGTGSLDPLEASVPNQDGVVQISGTLPGVVGVVPPRLLMIMADMDLVPNQPNAEFCAEVEDVVLDFFGPGVRIVVCTPPPNTESTDWAIDFSVQFNDGAADGAVTMVLVPDDVDEVTADMVRGLVGNARVWTFEAPDSPPVNTRQATPASVPAQDTLPDATTEPSEPAVPAETTPTPTAESDAPESVTPTPEAPAIPVEQVEQVEPSTPESQTAAPADEPAAGADPATTDQTADDAADVADVELSAAPTSPDVDVSTADD